MRTLKSIAESRDLLKNLKIRYEKAERLRTNFDSDSDSTGSNYPLRTPPRLYDSKSDKRNRFTRD